MRLSLGDLVDRLTIVNARIFARRSLGRDSAKLPLVGAPTAVHLATEVAVEAQDPQSPILRL